MTSRLAAFLAWAVVAASLAFWGLRLLARPLPVPPQALPVSLDQVVRGDVLKLFPAAPVAQQAQPQLASRFQLMGIIAPRAGSPGAGVALIAVDGKPARTFRVGARVDGPLVLQSVSARTAEIGPAGGPPAATLNTPALPAAATGRLPPPPALDAPAGPAADAIPAARPGTGEMAPPPGDEAPGPRRIAPDMAR